MQLIDSLIIQILYPIIIYIGVRHASSRIYIVISQHIYIYIYIYIKNLKIVRDEEVGHEFAYQRAVDAVNVLEVVDLIVGADL